MTAGPPGRVSAIEPPLKLSWSRLRLHSECPAKGDLVARGKKSPVADSRMYFPGTVCDVAMRRWLSQEPEPQPGWMEANVDSIIEEYAGGGKGDGPVRWKSVDDRRQVGEQCRAAVVQLERDLNVHCLPYDWDPARRFEVPIQVPRPGYPQPVQIFLIGEIDLLVRRPEGIVVWDLKITRSSDYWRKVLGQLLMYEVAVWLMTGSWPYRSGLLQPLLQDVTPVYEFTQDNRLQMLGRICSTAADIWTGRLDPSPEASKCRRCEVKHACPLFPVARGRVQGWGA